MSIPPWGADRPLTAEIASAAIRECFPAVDTLAPTHLGSGWEFDAWLTRDGWVFRFPRRADGQAMFEPERAVHALVAGVLPTHVRIPGVELVGRPTAEFPYAFAGHRFIPGAPADALPAALLPTAARELASALGAIHSIPEEDARAAGVTEMNSDDPSRAAWFERGLERAPALRGIDPVVDHAVHWLETSAMSAPRLEAPLRFIHHDLSPDHLLVDPATGALTGILDWTDAILGDAARDFVVLVTAFGWRFAEEVLVRYPHPVDQGFRERLGYMSRLLSIMWLAEAREQRSDEAKLAQWVRNAFAPGSERP